MFISNNPVSLCLCRKENLIKHQKVSRYYENDCRTRHEQKGNDSIERSQCDVAYIY